MASTEASRPQWLVFGSAQQGGTAKLWIGITKPVHDSLPHGTEAGSVCVPADPARAIELLPLLPEPAWPPLPPPSAESELGRAAFPPQAGAAKAASSPKAHSRRKDRQAIGRSVPRAPDGCEPFRRRHARRRSARLRMKWVAKCAPLALGFVQARA